MFLFSLIVSITAEDVIITSENVSEILNNTNHDPFMVMLYSEWCPHCIDLKPKWEDIVDYYKDDPRIRFGKICCDTEREVCGNFSKSGTPRVFFVSGTIDTAKHYTSYYSKNDFIDWIEKRLSLPIVDVYNHSQYLEILSKFQNNSLIMYQDLNPKDNETYSYLLERATKYDKYPVHFFNFKYDEFNTNKKYLANIFPAGNLTNVFNSRYNVKNLKKFVKANRFPPIGLATSSFISAVINSKDAFGLYYDNSNTSFIPNFTRIVKDFPPLLKVGIVDCEDKPRLCDMFGLRFDRGYQFSVIKSEKNIYYRYNRKWTEENLVTFARRAYRGREKAQGPGAGIRGFFFNLGDHVKEASFFPLILLISFVIVMSFVSLFAGINYMWGVNGGRAQKRRQQQREEALARERANTQKAEEEKVEEEEKESKEKTE